MRPPTLWLRIAKIPPFSSTPQVPPGHRRGRCTPIEQFSGISRRWLLTGDLGIEDEDGYFWFVGRKDDVISSGGYRIGPGEIEESLMGHEAVAMCAVVGWPDEIRGQVPAAFIVLKDEYARSDELAEQLRQHVGSRLAAHEVPRQITFIDELPRTTTGKILRRALRSDAGSC